MRPTRTRIFQSTPPVWGATEETDEADEDEDISIHAPRVGGDHFFDRHIFTFENFNPRPPCGGRQIRPSMWLRRVSYFNPRPPCGGRHF